MRALAHRASGTQTDEHSAGTDARSQSVIPDWYHCGMSKQIAVRLPDDIVEFVDSLVSDGAASSRAMVVSRALERERRRTIAARDAAILAQAGDDLEMQRLAEHLAPAPLDLA